MSGIVCAIRGGPASRETINKAVELAKDADLPLYFLFVINLDFLAHTAVSRVHTISHELSQMGDFILLAAQERAHAMGVEAQGLVRQGSVRDEIIDVCHEVEADYVVLGKPQGEEGEDIFTHERILEFSSKIEKESGAKVILIEGIDNE